MKILVTGANGQLGKSFRDIAPEHPGIEFLFLTREDLAIHHFDLVRNFFRGYHPDVCINCAAYTAVDKAESEKDLAFIVNGESTGVLAAVCREYGTRFIHISTDYVFNGEADRPYTEEDPTDPKSVYGASKREGELQALNLNPDSLIIRTSWVYSCHGNNFVKTMIRLMRERPSLRVVDDQWGSPTHARDLADCIMDIIHSGIAAPGIYHFSNDGAITWYQFAVAIREMTGSDCVIEPIPTSGYPTPARRPAYSVMSKEKISRVFHISLKPWRESLKACIDMIQAG